MHVGNLRSDRAFVHVSAVNGVTVEGNRVRHVPAVPLAEVAATMLNVGVDEGTAHVQVAVLSFLHEGVGDARAVGIVALEDAHSRNSDVVVGVLAAEDFVVVVLWSVVALLENFAEVVPRGDVFVALGGFGSFHTLFVLTVKGVVPHFGVDCKSSV